MKIMMKWLRVCFAGAALLIGLRWALMPLLAPPQGLHNGTEVDSVQREIRIMEE